MTYESRRELAFARIELIEWEEGKEESFREGLKKLMKEMSGEVITRPSLDYAASLIDRSYGNGKLGFYYSEDVGEEWYALPKEFRTDHKAVGYSPGVQRGRMKKVGYQIPCEIYDYKAEGLVPFIGEDLKYAEFVDRVNRLKKDMIETVASMRDPEEFNEHFVVANGVLYGMEDFDKSRLRKKERVNNIYVTEDWFGDTVLVNRTHDGAYAGTDKGIRIFQYLTNPQRDMPDLEAMERSLELMKGIVAKNSMEKGQTASVERSYGSFRKDDISSWEADRKRNVFHRIADSLSDSFDERHRRGGRRM